MKNIKSLAFPVSFPSSDIDFLLVQFARKQLMFCFWEGFGISFCSGAMENQDTMKTAKMKWRCSSRVIVLELK